MNDDKYSYHFKPEEGYYAEIDDGIIGPMPTEPYVDPVLHIVFNDSSLKGFDHLLGSHEKSVEECFYVIEGKDKRKYAFGKPFYGSEGERVWVDGDFCVLESLDAYKNIVGVGKIPKALLIKILYEYLGALKKFHASNG